MNFTFVELFNISGGFLGFILLLIILVNQKGKPIVKYSLAMFLLVGSAIVIIGTITFSGNVIYFPHFFRLDSPLHYLFGPVCFFYVLVSLKTDFKFKYIQLIHLLPFAINFIEFLPFYLSTSETKLENYNLLIETNSLIMPLHSALKASSVLIYLSLQLIVFYKYKPRNTLKNKHHWSLVSWLTIFLSGQIILIVGLIVNLIFGFELFTDAYQYTVIIEALFVYSTTIALLFFPSLLYGNSTDNSVNEVIKKEKYLHSKLTNEDKTRILDKLTSYLESNEKPFLNSRLNLSEVAKVVGATPQQVSQVINEKTNLNFNNYVNSYRIEKAKEILLTIDFTKHSMDSVAELAGFRSKSPFYLAFKKQVGKTPKEYILAQIDGV